MSEYNLVLCTVNTRDLANNIAKSLVSEKLAACVNISEHITSVYTWDNEVVEDNEILLIIKSKKNLFNKVEAKIKQLHTYDVPEIISIDIQDGSKDYLKWLNQSVQ